MLRFAPKGSFPVHVGSPVNVVETLPVGTTGTETSALNVDVLRLLWVATSSATSDLHITNAATAATTDTLLQDGVAEVFQWNRGDTLRVICSATATTDDLGLLYVSGARYD